MRYKADGTDELAQHSEVPISLPEVNRGVVHRNNALLPGEASMGCNAGFNLPTRHCRLSSNGRVVRRGVSRGRSSRIERAGSSCRRVTRPANGPEASGAGKDRTEEGGTTGRRVRATTRAPPRRTQV